MSIETYLNPLLRRLIMAQAPLKITHEQLIKCIDLTLLELAPSPSQLNQLADWAKSYPLAAVCVYTQDLSYFPPPINTASVVNFPHANNTDQDCLDEIKRARSMGVSEIDYVFPYHEYLKGHEEKALSQCQLIIDYCKQHGLISKIILETGAFPNMQRIYEVSGKVIELGANFLKTSTGKIPEGATYSAAVAMLCAIKDAGKPCGIKLSGGIRTPKDAAMYAYLAEELIGQPIDNSWFRIGASSLLNALISS